MQNDIRFGGFQMEILGYQYPKLNDYWDGNWVIVEISCEAGGERMAFRDPCIRTDELACFGEELPALLQRKSEQATMDTMEPYVKWQISRTTNEKFTAKVRLRQNTETAEFDFELGYEELAVLEEQVSAAIFKFPVRGKNDVP